MAPWSAFAHEAPELASSVKARFEATGLAFMATLRRDGSPRLSGIEPLIDLGEVWLGMMDGSRKTADLERDPRLALHAASVDKDVADGDAKLAGAAVAATDDEFKAFATALSAKGGDVPPGRFPLFRVDLYEASFLRPEPGSGCLDIRWWRPGTGVQRVERR